MARKRKKRIINILLGKRNAVIYDEYGWYINASRERRLLKSIFVITIFIIIIYWWLSQYYDPWYGWAEEDANNGDVYYYRNPLITDIFWNIIIFSISSFFYTFIVVAIKIGTVDPTKMEAYNVSSRDTSKGRKFAAFMLILLVLQILTYGTDYFIQFTVLLTLTIISLGLYQMRRKKSGEKFGIITDFFLFGEDFRRAVIMFTLSLGILNIVGASFMIWFESEWAAEYYLEEYSNGLFSDFDLMIASIRIMGVILIAAAIIIARLSRKR